ncbi:hypothetical protein HYV57_02155 [Candidatus Peregrinibacteria bacterium]|nr:hypothetical protein [Candidatus Peregrinibacteria bacterium]
MNKSESRHAEARPDHTFFPLKKNTYRWKEGARRSDTRVPFKGVSL